MMNPVAYFKALPWIGGLGIAGVEMIAVVDGSVSSLIPQQWLQPTAMVVLAVVILKVIPIFLKFIKEQRKDFLESLEKEREAFTESLAEERRDFKEALYRISSDGKKD